MLAGFVNRYIVSLVHMNTMFYRTHTHTYGYAAATITESSSIVICYNSAKCPGYGFLWLPLHGGSFRTNYVKYILVHLLFVIPNIDTHYHMSAMLAD